MTDDWKGEHLISKVKRNTDGGGLYNPMNLRKSKRSSRKTQQSEERAERRAKVKHLAGLGLSVAQIAAALDSNYRQINADFVGMGIPVSLDERERVKE
ncbi:hypothetical protein GCM10011360_17730 [Primorskyibacter flagellatus]|uniref:Uncharacterized protein n=1 Tax=Primorskyibacter flagellatus TaxID=1387277 RepID=A0A917EEI8_9RHOB|nr:hypothetical protein [Primorskyibacter flagellatus]GGE30124.1 hypothetical protein GCM10011360_17730 [Primorskyibacter flagellatus]